jgi:hypothetical protein
VFGPQKLAETWSQRVPAGAGHVPADGDAVAALRDDGVQARGVDRPGGGAAATGVEGVGGLLALGHRSRSADGLAQRGGGQPQGQPSQQPGPSA